MYTFSCQTSISYVHNSLQYGVLSGWQRIKEDASRVLGIHNFTNLFHDARHNSEAKFSLEILDNRIMYSVLCTHYVLYSSLLLDCNHCMGECPPGTIDLFLELLYDFV